MADRTDLPIPLAGIAELFGRRPFSPSFADRLYSYGAAPSENIEDRRSDLAFRGTPEIINRNSIFDLGLPVAPRRLPWPSQLTRDIGLEDIRYGNASR